MVTWFGAAHVSAAVAKVAAGGAQTIFIKDDGSLWRLSGMPIPISGGTNVSTVATGGTHMAFVKVDGTLWAQGDNRYGQLGDGTTTARSTSVQVNGGTNVIAVATGGYHTVFLKADGTLWAMGDNSHGQLGDGTTTSRSTPVPVSGGTSVTAVAAGYGYTVFIKTDGTLWAAGENTYGQLGNGTTTDRSTPVQVSGGIDVAAVAAGGYHTVFLKTDGTLWAMGANSYGQLGNQFTGNQSHPVQIGASANNAAIAAGGYHTAFLKTDGTLWTMGYNSNGQLGDGTTTDRHTPVQISGDSNVTAVAAGVSHTIFLKTNGRLWGTGQNVSGQLSSINPSSVTVPALINQSILLTPIGAKSVALGSTLSFTVDATDADNDTLTYSASNLPIGATFTPATRTFSWSPATFLSPFPAVTFTVTDGVVTVSEVVFINMIDDTPPSVPAGLSGSAASPHAISLTWTSSTDNVGVTFYRVYRNGAEVSITASSSFSDSGLQAGTTYSYTVAAVDRAGNASAHSASISVTTTSLTGPQTRNVTNASTLNSALVEAANNPAATFTINLAGGTYTLSSTPLPNISISGTTIQGPLSAPDAIIDGTGLSGGVVFNVTASGVTISGVTFRNVATHAITIQPNANSGYILGCSFYGTGATAAILGRGCTDWIVAVNEIYDIAGTVATAEPAIYFYEGSTSLSVANNLIQDCDRGIGFGSGATENNGNVWIFNNMISDTRTVSHGGPGIRVSSITSSGTSIDNNTVYQVGGYTSAIEYNNNSATITLRNNLTNRALTGSNSPSVVTATNNTSAVAAWFRDPNDCDLRLTSAVSGVVNAGTAITGLTIDIEGDTRPSGGAFDIGADEYIQPVSPNPPPSPNPPAPASSGGGGGAPSHWFFCALAMIAIVRKVRR